MKLKIIAILALVSFGAFLARAEVTEIDDIWDIKYNHRPMVIEAYATWCQPCKVYGPIFARLSHEYEGKVDFYKVNVDSQDAAEFVDRYEVNSVPLTVFLWDPNGDATVKHSVERGLMGYDELKYYIEATLEKQYKQKAYTTTSGLGWSSGVSPDGLIAYSEYTPKMNPFIGEWEGLENGYESKLWFFKEGVEIQGVGGALDPSRFSVINSVYWLVLGFGWDDEKDTLYMSDVLPSQPSSIFSHVDNGTFRMRYFKKVNDRIVMDVEEYRVDNGNLSSTPSRVYSVEYHKPI